MDQHMHLIFGLVYLLFNDDGSSAGLMLCRGNVLNKGDFENLFC